LVDGYELSFVGPAGSAVDSPNSTTSRSTRCRSSRRPRTLGP